MLIRILLFNILFAVLSSFSNSALAWDGVANGTIKVFEITHANNFAFRVHINGAGEMCGSGSALGWAYLNESDSNYKMYVANLMMARTLDKPVILYLNRLANTPYCNIQHMSY